MGLDSLQLFGPDGTELLSSGLLHLHAGGGGGGGGGASAGGASASAAAAAPSHIVPPLLHAHPADVNSLPDVAGDPRTVDKLCLPHPGSSEEAAALGTGAHVPWAAPPAARKHPADCWLSPWSPESANELSVVFNELTSLSLVCQQRAHEHASSVLISMQAACEWASS